MSTPSNAPPKSFTAQEVDEWLFAAKAKCAALHIKAADALNSAQCHEAFTDMSELLQQAFDSVIKFFQVDITGMVRMTSSARYCNAGVGSRRPN